jgi:uncharacterized alpha-E superfamily protein
MQGVADRLARQREGQLASSDIDQVFRSGLHEFLQQYIRDNAALDTAIAEQFRFG